MGINATDVYLHVDMTHGSFSSMKLDATAKHRANAPGTALSVTPNVAGTEALIKVRGGKGWTPGWFNAPFVKRVYTDADHADIFAFFYTPVWQEPDKRLQP